MPMAAAELTLGITTTTPPILDMAALLFSSRHAAISTLMLTSVSLSARHAEQLTGYHLTLAIMVQ